MTDFGTAGGALAPAWGGTIKLHVWVALGAGSPWKFGPNANDRLDGGNVMYRTVGVEPDPSTATVSRLWVDVSCDVVDLTITTGATKAEGVQGRAEAGTATLVLADPDRRLDPLNPDSPWLLRGRTRLTPGAPVLVWTESLQAGTFVIRHTLFVGTVDSWRTPWTPHRSERRSILQCSDATSTLVASSHPEVAAEGAGDFVDERLQRILTANDGPVLLAQDSNVTLAATTLPGTAWEQLNRAADDEIGFVHVAPYAANPLDYLYLTSLIAVRFLARSIWVGDDPVTVTVDCPVTIAATADALDLDVRNQVTAQRKDGVAVTVRSQQSIDRYGLHAYSKTDLGLADDTQVAEWANFVLAMNAFPRPALSDVTLRPAHSPESWPSILGVDLVSERVQVLWDPAGATSAYNVTARVIGIQHSINRDRWEVKWSLAAAQANGQFFTIGDDPHDALDSGNVLAFSRIPTVVRTFALVTETGLELVTETGDVLVDGP